MRLFFAFFPDERGAACSENRPHFILFLTTIISSKLLRKSWSRNNLGKQPTSRYCNQRRLAQFVSLAAQRENYHYFHAQSRETEFWDRWQFFWTFAAQNWFFEHPM
jgi:hypothetical protein